MNISVILVVTLFNFFLGIKSESSKYANFVFPNEAVKKIAPVKIVNGLEASANQFPYQVALYIQQDLTEVFCGGSLISTSYVLTAAHCTSGAVTIDVILGGYNISDDSESTRQRQTSTSYINHPDWDRATLTNDLALIKLSTAVQLNDYVQTIQLASGDDTFASEEGTAAGWGLTSDTQTTVTQILRYETNPILSNEECKSVDADYNNVIQDTHVCLSGDGNKSICGGDSGGPLVTNNTQVGVTSFSYKSCEVGKPSVFTRVSEFIQWIQDNSDVVVVS